LKWTFRVRLRGLLIATSRKSHAEDEARGEQTKVHEGILQALSVYTEFIQDETELKR
jgi:hypothetical protein